MNHLGNKFRVALFAAAASLVGYIGFKYATQLHAAQGFYGFLFPLSGVLAAAGVILAWQPRKACDCSVGVRAGIGLLAGLWLIAGVACVPTLAAAVAKNPASGLFATFQMLAQHVFLSLSVLAFALVPRTMARMFGVPAVDDAVPNEDAGVGVLSGN